ncbi:glycoside hydrolase family 16 protein [Pseudonocardia humida]|uniref:Glycoside hydrolase family 16 protein n=1 Tax=Pseudonocardia humida TaxID=2800819 RepID=A0ABT1A2R2_9PSEU|nr:family 16 glycosylhydrolase [Pseudonocardia humida]MCO1657246.1 glycoside hydrolase family 16 protein [Pseudonocardia humida]
MPDTHELAVVHPYAEPRPPRWGTIILTLLLTIVLGLGLALFLVVGFWPDPAPRTSAAVDRAQTADSARSDTGDRADYAATALPGGRFELDPTIPAGTEAAARYSWPLLQADEFDGTALNPLTWQPYEGGAAGAVGQRSASNLTVSGGTLKVTSRGLTSGGMGWQPGQTYGRWEVRARTEAGAGYRPAILLWPDGEDWPIGGEIDFLDTPHPDRSETNFVVHYGAQNSQDGVAVEGDFTGWHTYAVEWAPDHVAGFVDGQEVFRTTDPQKIPTGPMRLTIQQDIGPSEDGWTPAPATTTPAEVQMEVDWVRIYAAP